MRADDLPLLQSVSRPSAHPDGDRAVVAVTRPDLAADAYVGQLWMVGLDGALSARRITRGFLDTEPQFSPDGRMIAFLRAGADAIGQVHIVDSGGGEPFAITDAPLGVDRFRWSPDSRRIAFIARAPEHGRYGTVPGLPDAAEPPRRFTTTRFRADGVGYTIDRRLHAFLIDVPAPDAEPNYQTAPSIDDPRPGPSRAVPLARQITSGDADHTALCFAPDGASVIVIAARHPGRDRDLRTDLWRIDLSRRSPLITPITADEPPRLIVEVEATPSGRLFFLAQELGPEGRDFVARSTGLFVLDAGSSAGRLTDADRIDLGGPSSAITIIDDDRVYVQVRDQGSVQLLLADAHGVAERVTTSSAIEVRGVAVVPGTDDAVLTIAAGDTSGDVVRLRQGRIEARTDFSKALRRSGIRPARGVVVTARDGRPVHGWVLEPTGEGPHPVLLMIHGGPFASFGPAVFDEAQVCVDAGYAVLLCNPRGSAGYGQAHGRAVRGRLGTVDMDDVLDFLDGVLDANPRLDRSRLGVMGGSYGGWLTALITAHHDRFAGAIIERGFLDAEGFAGTSDIGTIFVPEYVGADPDTVRAQSPQAHVASVRTPTLLLHAEHDLRCPLDQAERYYQALRAHGVEAELVVFPGEHHELSRSGRPRHRVQRFEIILDWWRRHLSMPA